MDQKTILSLILIILTGGLVLLFVFLLIRYLIIHGSHAVKIIIHTLSDVTPQPKTLPAQENVPVTKPEVIQTDTIQPKQSSHTIRSSIIMLLFGLFTATLITGSVAWIVQNEITNQMRTRVIAKEQKTWDNKIREIRRKVEYMQKEENLAKSYMQVILFILGIAVMAGLLLFE